MIIYIYIYYTINILYYIHITGFYLNRISISAWVSNTKSNIINMIIYIYIYIYIYINIYEKIHFAIKT